MRRERTLGRDLDVYVSLYERDGRGSRILRVHVFDWDVDHILNTHMIPC